MLFTHRQNSMLPDMLTLRVLPATTSAPVHNRRAAALFNKSDGVTRVSAGQALAAIKRHQQHSSGALSLVRRRGTSYAHPIPVALGAART